MKFFIGSGIYRTVSGDAAQQGSRVLGISTISTGGTDGTFVDAKVVFAAALTANASSIVLSHNHPAGNLLPSEPDKRLTRRPVEIGRALDLPVLDHIILGRKGYYSFADEGSLRSSFFKRFFVVH